MDCSNTEIHCDGLVIYCTFLCLSLSLFTAHIKSESIHATVVINNYFAFIPTCANGINCFC